MKLHLQLPLLLLLAVVHCSTDLVASGRGASNLLRLPAHLLAQHDLVDLCQHITDIQTNLRYATALNLLQQTL
jgi:D-alanyl-D-alanine dipeptidase